MEFLVVLQTHGGDGGLEAAVAGVKGKTGNAGQIGTVGGRQGKPPLRPEDKPAIDAQQGEGGVDAELHRRAVQLLGQGDVLL